MTKSHQGNPNNINVGDYVGYYMRDRGHPDGYRLITCGYVTRVYQTAKGKWWKAEVDWDNPRLSFIYTGNSKVCYIAYLTLIQRETKRHV